MQHTGDINSNLENMNIRIEDIELLDKTGMKTLMDLRSSGIDDIDYAAYLNAVRPPCSWLILCMFFCVSFVFVFL